MKKSYVVGAVCGATAAAITGMVIIPKAAKKIKNYVLKRKTDREYTKALNRYQEMSKYITKLEADYTWLIADYKETKDEMVKSSICEIVNVYVQEYEDMIEAIDELSCEWGFEPVEAMEMECLL